MTTRTALAVAATVTAAGLVLGVVYAQSVPGAQNTTSKHGRQSMNLRMTAPPEVRARIEALRNQGYRLEKKARTQMSLGDLAGAEETEKQAIVIYETYQPDLHIVLLPVAASQRQFLGDIYLKGGQYQKALETYGVVGKFTHGEGATVGPTLNLSVALAYCGLGNYEAARHYYSDKAITQYSFGGKPVAPADLPGTDTPQALEASIRLALGIDAYFHEENADAANDFAAAGQAMPNNPLLNYYWSDTLMRLHRFSEAAPHAEVAARLGRGPLAEIAVRKVIQARSGMDFLSKHPNYYAQHQDETSQPPR